MKHGDARFIRLFTAAALAGLLLAGTMATPVRAIAPTTARGVGVDQDTVTVDEPTEAALRGAMNWLASRQMPSGAWSDNRSHQAAMTGYVLMAFMATGNLPNEGEHGKNVARGVQFLLDCVRPDGYIIAPSEANSGQGMYGHGIATIALAEAYGQTRDPAIRPKLEKAIRLIITCQNDKGAWRYQPRVMDGDISVTVLQVVALRAAQNSGIAVPQATIDRAVKYVRSCRDEKSGGFTYQPHSNKPGFARTAAAIYSLQVCGVYDDPIVAAGSKYLVDGNFRDREWFTYGNFYAAPAQYMIGGPTWKDWYQKLNKMLLAKRKSDGDKSYWEPLDGSKGVGPVYATAVYSTILAMPYHYIPLYQR